MKFFFFLMVKLLSFSLLLKNNEIREKRCLLQHTVVEASDGNSLLT